MWYRYAKEALARSKDFIPRDARFESPSTEEKLRSRRFHPVFKGDPNGYPGRVEYEMRPRHKKGLQSFQNQRGKTVYYDPEIAERFDDPERPYGGQTRLRAESGYSDAFPELENDPGHLYRGISHQEYQKALKDGYFQSDGRMNMEGEEGHTLFALWPSTADAYATSFAPERMQPTFREPGYIIKIKQPEHVEDYDYTTNYKGVKGQIPLENMVAAWEARLHSLEPGTGDIRQRSVKAPYEYETGSSSSPIQSYGYRQCWPQQDPE